MTTSAVNGTNSESQETTISFPEKESAGEAISSQGEIEQDGIPTFAVSEGRLETRVPQSGPGGFVMPRTNLRSNGAIYEAMGILESWNFKPSKIVSSETPVDIIAFRNEMAFLVQVIYSKGAVPDAKTLEQVFKTEVNNLRAMGTSAQFRKIVMAYSRKCGWKYYDVLPGGLIPAWDLPEAGTR